MDHFEDVKDFQGKVGFPEGSLELCNIERLKQRAKLIAEEFVELMETMGLYATVFVGEKAPIVIEDVDDPYFYSRTGIAERPNKAHMLKELCDLAYVVEGTACEAGFDYDGARRRVHLNNMEKVTGDVTIIDGKVQKKKGLKKPVLDDLV